MSNNSETESVIKKYTNRLGTTTRSALKLSCLFGLLFLLFFIVGLFVDDGLDCDSLLEDE